MRAAARDLHPAPGTDPASLNRRRGKGSGGAALAFGVVLAAAALAFAFVLLVALAFILLVAALAFSVLVPAVVTGHHVALAQLGKAEGVVRRAGDGARGEGNGKGGTERRGDRLQRQLLHEGILLRSLDGTLPWIALRLSLLSPGQEPLQTA